MPTPSSTSPSSAARPAAAGSAITPASRPPTPADYRGNIDRQTREQKSIGGILNIIVYSLIALFVIGASLAGYGAKIIFQQIHQQSATMSDLDNRYAAENQAITAQLKTSQEAIIQLQAQTARQQELILHQQEAINKLLAASADAAAGMRQLKATQVEEAGARASEIASLRARVRLLESKSPEVFRP
jgi:hypothetical protein